MAKHATVKNDDPFKRVRSHAEDMRIALNQISPGLGYKLGNVELLNEIKEEIRYENGETLPPKSENMCLIAALNELPWAQRGS